MFSLLCCCTNDHNTTHDIIQVPLPGPELESGVAFQVENAQADISGKSPPAEPAKEAADPLSSVPPTTVAREEVPPPVPVARQEAAQDRPTEAAQEVTISIAEPAVDLGLDIEKQSPRLDVAVLRVRDGPIKDWNEHNPTQAIVHGDSIIAVNDCSLHTEEMLAELQKPGKLRITFRKAQEFNVSIVKSEDASTMGIDIVHSGNVSLFIRNVRAGLIEEHNRKSGRDSAIDAGDRIVVVNGSRGDSTNLLDLIKASKTLNMTISRNR